MTVDELIEQLQTLKSIGSIYGHTPICVINPHDQIDAETSLVLRSSPEWVDGDRWVHGGTVVVIQ